MNRDAERMLYPFLHPDDGNGRTPATDALDGIRRSTLQKAADVTALRRQLRDEYADRLVEAARALADAFADGARLLAFGNGGSATDAQDAAADCLAPPHTDWRTLPALALVNDTAIVTALANDVGIETIFARQLMALGRPGDVALGITTSGSSANVAAGLAEARRRNMRTIAFTGYDGGDIERDNLADFCFVSRSEHIPRIQEGHATLWHALLEQTQAFLDDGPAGSVR